MYIYICIYIYIYNFCKIIVITCIYITHDLYSDDYFSAILFIMIFV